MRDMVFLSHANPEDNEFTLWLSLQLAREGYPVWCDLTQLLGGEDFWKDAEKAIRNRTLKFVYVLSKTSNQKNGPLRELRIAQNVAQKESFKDFVIPVRIDDIAHADINIEIGRINAIDFHIQRASGLNTLLEKFEKDGLTKSPQFDADAVCSWWRSQFDSESSVTNKKEEYFSNWFPIRRLPPNIYFHQLQRYDLGKYEFPNTLSIPAILHSNYAFTFAPAEDLDGKLGDSMSIVDSHCHSTLDFLDGKAKQGFANRKQSRNLMTRLLRIAWEMMAVDRKFLAYELSGNAKCFFRNDVGNKRFSVIIDDKRHSRSIMGYKSRKNKAGEEIWKRYWHFAFQGKPQIHPFPAYIIKYHVVFSSDGINIWESKKKMHRARRTQCKEWWNSHWLDRILIMMNLLADKDGEIHIKVGEDIYVEVSNSPVVFNSPVSYKEPKKEEPKLDDIIDEDEEMGELGGDE